jgi:hypothetical protein
MLETVRLASASTPRPTRLGSQQPSKNPWAASPVEADAGLLLRRAEQLIS